MTMSWGFSFQVPSRRLYIKSTVTIMVALLLCRRRMNGRGMKYNILVHDYGQKITGFPTQAQK